MKPGRPRYHNKATFVSWLDEGEWVCTMYRLGKENRDAKPIVVAISELPEVKEQVLVATVPEHTSITKGDEVVQESWDVTNGTVNFFDFLDF